MAATTTTAAAEMVTPMLRSLHHIELNQVSSWNLINLQLLSTTTSALLAVLHFNTSFEVPPSLLLLFLSPSLLFLSMTIFCNDPPSPFFVSDSIPLDRLLILVHCLAVCQVSCFVHSSTLVNASAPIDLVHVHFMTTQSVVRDIVSHLARVE